MYIKYNNSKLDWNTIITKVDQKEIKKNYSHKSKDSVNAKRAFEV